MCTCSLKSKTPSGTQGNFNYVYTCTKADGTTIDVQIKDENDDVRAKCLARRECEARAVPLFERKKVLSSKTDSQATIVAYVETDTDFFYVFPDPCTSFYYKVNKEVVIRVSNYSSINCNNREIKPLFVICFNVTGIVESVRLGSDGYKAEDIIAESRFSALTLNARINFNADGKGEGVIKFDGKTYPCLGKPGLAYPDDLTVTTGDKFPRRFSNEFCVWMENAILIWGQRGIFIHSGPATLSENGGPSAGCIHLEEAHSVEFYNWINQNTRIQISYPW